MSHVHSFSSTPPGVGSATSCTAATKAGQASLITHLSYQRKTKNYTTKNVHTGTHGQHMLTIPVTIQTRGELPHKALIQQDRGSTEPVSHYQHILSVAQVIGVCGCGFADATAWQGRVQAQHETDPQCPPPFQCCLSSSIRLELPRCVRDLAGTAVPIKQGHSVPARQKMLLLPVLARVCSSV